MTTARNSWTTGHGSAHAARLSANRRIAGLRRGHSPRDAILALFAAVFDEACSSKGKRGCFLANAALELAASNKAVAAIVRRAFAETEEFFAATIRDGQETGSIRLDVDAEATARSLLALLLGIRVLARAGAPAATLESITRQVSDLL